MNRFKSLQVIEQEGRYSMAIVERPMDELPAGEVLIRVHYSSVNYKDALSATGNKGVTRRYPHTPGVDAAGVVVESAVGDFQAGDEVLVTGFDLGMNTSGGFSEYIRVPAAWVLLLPPELSMKDSMSYGTAGFTAGLSVAALLKSGIIPASGSVAVSGATGGVGSIAIAILKRLGFSVAAISSKTDAQAFLSRIGADEIISRTEMEDSSSKFLLKPRFAAAIDTVGGRVLATLLKSLHYGGVVTACGMVNGPEVPTSVFPFILKGVQLIGVDSVEMPLQPRNSIWKHLATDWKPETLQEQVKEITLEQVPEAIQTILDGGMQGRVLVRISN
ncbi:YhdH/YhfP family quinone oxidoreductase [Pedobacter sp. SYSU D00535]|uniref:YhdH/YhfP family quinone oxidoreductase n=1 Tax=Pedobacter sp. SYSU D00535 TaxID=2810308 RepID=UPI001A9626FE|nr:YhdH/YhfP family quinone oxidoreductase [Pedobacter sp. SYSU D00535]